MRFDLLQFHDIIELLIIGILLGIPLGCFGLRCVRLGISQILYALSVKKNFKRRGTLALLAEKEMLRQQNVSTAKREHAAEDELVSLARHTAETIKLKREDS